MSGLSSGSAIQFARATHDFGALVGDALEVAGNLRGREHEPAILRHRAVRGDVGDDEVVDVDFQSIDLAVVGFDRVAQFVVAIDERPQRERETSFGKPAHHQKLLSDVGELLFPEMVHGGSAESAGDVILSLLLHGLVKIFSVCPNSISRPR